MRLSFPDNQPKAVRDLIKAAWITVLAFLLSFVLMQPLSFSAMSVFAPPEKDDFTISDFYAQVADRRPVRALDQDIVLVDIGSLDRAGIASLLETLSLCGVRALGLDVMFSDPMPGDSLLLSALAMNPGIVLPLNLRQTEEGRFDIAEKPFFYGEIPGVTYGAANLPGKFRGATIREFSSTYLAEGGGSYESLPVKLARQADPEAVKRLLDRSHTPEAIDFPSREFVTISWEEVFDRAEELEGKIVLAGALTDASDMHSTPVNSYLSGVYIHACALSTILGGRFYTRNPAATDWILAACLCFLVTLIGLRSDPRMKGLVTRLLQFLLVYLAVQVGYALYVEKRMIVNFSYTLLMVTFGLLAADLWNGSLGLVAVIREKHNRRKQSKQ